MIKFKRRKKIIGWREWVSLPDFGIAKIKVKVDSGARTSALHVSQAKTYKRGGKRFVKFIVHPIQRKNKPTYIVHAPLIEKRTIRSSVGHETIRPVVCTTLEVANEKWPIEITLVNRDVMGFRMLLGREAVKDRYLLDPA